MHLDLDPVPRAFRPSGDQRSFRSSRSVPNTSSKCSEVSSNLVLMPRKQWDQSVTKQRILRREGLDTKPHKTTRLSQVKGASKLGKKSSLSTGASTSQDDSVVLPALPSTISAKLASVVSRVAKHLLISGPPHLMRHRQAARQPQSASEAQGSGPSLPHTQGSLLAPFGVPDHDQCHHPRSWI
ncbi:unnamed protein product [Caretta caretta]